MSPSLLWTAAERPFVYLLLLQHESIEVYRQQQRRLLRSWVERHLEHHDEWLVVAVSPLSSSEAVIKQQKKYTDKIRTDLSSKDRVLRLPLGSYDPTHQPVAEQLWKVRHLFSCLLISSVSFVQSLSFFTVSSSVSLHLLCCCLFCCLLFSFLLFSR